jgi:hypothetical protein
MGKQAKPVSTKDGWSFRKGYQGQDPPQGVKLTPPKGPAAWVPTKEAKPSAKGGRPKR